MDELESPESRQRVDRWMEEGQHLLARVIPDLLAQRDRLRGRVQVAEQERDKLRQELGVLNEEIAALRAETQRYRGEQATAAQALGLVVEHVNQTLTPLTELLHRLQGTPRGA